MCSTPPATMRRSRSRSARSGSTSAWPRGRPASARPRQRFGEQARAAVEIRVGVPVQGLVRHARDDLAPEQLSRPLQEVRQVERDLIIVDSICCSSCAASSRGCSFELAESIRASGVQIL